MSTAATKARKRRQRETGTPFTKVQKTPTPVAERSFVTAAVHRRAGDAQPTEAAIQAAKEQA